MEEERVIPETHTFDGDIIALRDWAQDTAEHYEIPAGGVAVAYDGRAQLSVTDWNDPALPTQRTPWINEGDTVTFDEKTRFGVRPGHDTHDLFDELDRIESIANHPAGKAQLLADPARSVQATRSLGRN